MVTGEGLIFQHAAVLESHDSRPHRDLRRYGEIRAESERLAAPLQIEDYVVQSMPDASPAKWHLAHTSWFFDTFVLQKLGGGLARNSF